MSSCKTLHFRKTCLLSLVGRHDLLKDMSSCLKMHFYCFYFLCFILLKTCLFPRHVSNMAPRHDFYSVYLTNKGQVWLWLLETVRISHFWILSTLSRYDLHVFPHDIYVLSMWSGIVHYSYSWYRYSLKLFLMYNRCVWFPPFFHIRHSWMSTPWNSCHVSINVMLKSWCVLVDVILRGDNCMLLAHRP